MFDSIDRIVVKENHNKTNGVEKMANKILHTILLTCAIISGSMVIVAPYWLDSAEALAVVINGLVILFASFILAFWGIE